MQELTIIKHNGGYYVDSREVAEAIGKRHDNLLRDIAKYREIIARRGLLNFEESDFFLEFSYFNAQNKEMPCYLISKMGAEIIANKLTGEKGVLFTIAYVTKFNLMEQRERAAEFASYHPKLGEFNKAARLIANAYQNAGANSGDIVKFLENVYEPLGIEVLGDGLQYSGLPAHLYSPFQMAREMGIYSMYGRPHCLAIAAVLRKLDIAPEHKIITPARYGEYIGIVLRYDEEAFDALKEWFWDNDFPTTVEAEYCDFHLRYSFY
jgi:Rha family phage regulatory protein